MITIFKFMASQANLQRVFNFRYYNSVSLTNVKETLIYIKCKQFCCLSGLSTYMNEIGYILVKCFMSAIKAEFKNRLN